VKFTPDRPEKAPDHRMPRAELQAIFKRNRQRMQAVLRDRFGLVLRAETRELPILALTVDRGGLKMKPASATAKTFMSTNRTKMTGSAVNMTMLTAGLAQLVGRYVVDETGLDGLYDVELDWTKELAEATSDDLTASASLYTLITEQLGLKFVAKRGPVPVFVVEKVEKPTEN
jgi:uncharacterized protein (TIGR03435 family)